MGLIRVSPLHEIGIFPITFISPTIFSNNLSVHPYLPLSLCPTQNLI